MVDVFAEKNVEFCGGIGGIKEENVDRLKHEQITWLNELFHNYFYHPSFKYHKLPARIDEDCLPEMLKGHLHFAHNQPLVLPEHLQYRENANEPPTMELDVPGMLGHEQLSLINENHLEELQEKARKERFNVFKYLIRREFWDLIANEEILFFENFRHIYPGADYDENIPELFFDELDKLNVFRESDEDEDNIYVLDYSNMLMHEPDHAVQAYQYFARKKYTLRAFGEWLKKKGWIIETPKDSKGLKALLFKYIEDGIEGYDFYRNLLETDGPYFELPNPRNRDPTIHYEEFEQGELRVAFGEMVDYVLEGKKRGNDIHNPTNSEDLIDSIKKKSNYSWLSLQYHKEDLPDFSGSEETIIRDNFNEIVKYLDSPNLSEKLRSILISVRGPLQETKTLKEKGKTSGRIWAMRELLRDPKSQGFLSEPAIEKIFSKLYKGQSFKDRLLEINNKRRSRIRSMDETIYRNDKGDKFTRHDFEEGKKEEDKKEAPFWFNEIENRKEEEIRASIRKEFSQKVFSTEAYENFVNELEYNFEILLKKRQFIQNLKIPEIKHNDNILQLLKVLFKHYTKLCGFTDEELLDEELLKPIRKNFNGKIRNILRITREMLLEEISKQEKDK
jgi:hypothetical protein